MEQSFGYFDSPAKAARKRIHHVFAAIQKTQPLHGAFHTAAQIGAVKTMQMALAAQVLFDGERLIETLRLENHADALAHGSRVLSGIKARDQSAALGGDHHGGENPEESRFAAAVRP